MLDVSVTEGTVNEREVLESQVEAVRELSGRDPALVTAECGLRLTSKVYAALERRGVAFAHPVRRKNPPQSRVPLRLFRYDAAARHREVSTGQDAESPPARKGRALTYRSRTRDCVGLRAQARLPAEGVVEQGACWSRTSTRRCCARDGAMRDGAS